MKENNLYKRFTIKEVLYELSSIKAVVIDNKDLIIDHLTKTAKDIYNYFGCNYPVNIF
jgi:hypothetical protein